MVSNAELNSWLENLAKEYENTKNYVQQLNEHATNVGKITVKNPIVNYLTVFDKD